jgi:hypothetical protein
VSVGPAVEVKRNLDGKVIEYPCTVGAVERETTALEGW